MYLCVFEDEAWRDLWPFSLVRPAYEMLLGTGTVSQRLFSLYPDTVLLRACRRELRDALSERLGGQPVNVQPEGPCLFINGRVIPEPDLSRKLPLEGEDALYVAGSTIVGVRLRTSNSRVLDELPLPLASGAFSSLPTRQVSVRLAETAWDLVDANGDAIRAAYAVPGGADSAQAPPSVTVTRPEATRIGRGVHLGPGTVLDAGAGPVTLEDDVVIEPGVYVRGPAWVGQGAVLQAGARVVDGVSIGSGEYLVLYKDETGADGFTFGFGATDAARLFDGSMTLVDETNWEDGQAPLNMSWGRLPNGTGDFQTLSDPTPGEANEE